MNADLKKLALFKLVIPDVMPQNELTRNYKMQTK